MQSPKPPSEKIVRQPIILHKKDWAVNTRQVVMGIDPGYTRMGLAILEQPQEGQRLRALAVRIVKTQPAKKKHAGNFRVANDDQRRFTELWNGLEDLYGLHHPYAVGVEGYNPFKRGRIGGGEAQSTISGWKAGGVFVGVQFWSLSRHLVCTVFLPSDLKKRFCGKQSASKDDVAAQLFTEVENLEALVLKVPGGMREHVTDAAGHAVLALEEVRKMRRMLGLEAT